VSTLTFASREDITQYEWDNQRKDWKRPAVDPKVLKQLSARSTVHGFLRLAFFLFLLVASALATVYVSRVNIWLAIPVLYVYWFFYGFWAAPAHELQHKSMFGPAFDGFSEVLFRVVFFLLWTSPTYARISHKLHHRYTMVRGLDPETDWPDVISTKWLRRFVLYTLSRVLVVGALYELFKAVRMNAQRVAGRLSASTEYQVEKPVGMRDHCTDEDIRRIRVESGLILLGHSLIAAAAVVFGRWELLLFITIAWQVGQAMESLWHATKHIARPKNVNDHRLNTRSIKVSWFIKIIFWGLDDHVEHHLYPIVPASNLPKLHRVMQQDLPEAHNFFGCWAEMFETARQKDQDPNREFVSVESRGGEKGAVDEQKAEALWT
jgi:fatty acid desaturase